jgi:hypothetical protein
LRSGLPASLKSTLGIAGLLSLAALAGMSQMSMFGTGKLSKQQFVFRLLTSLVIAIVCSFVFAVGSPVAP